MKKILALILSIVTVFSFAACGDTNDGDIADTSAAENIDTSADAADTVADTTAMEDVAETTAAQTDAKDTLAIDETVVIDNEYCTVTLTGIEEDDFWGTSIKVKLENKSADKNYSFNVNDATINGVYLSASLYADVKAGKKANDEITLYVEDIEELDIGQYTDIAITLSVSDADDWMADPVVNETFHVYPYGEENASVFAREAQPTDLVLIDNEYVTLTLTGYEEEDEIWQTYDAKLFIVNKTDKNLSIDANDVYVNDYSIDPFFYYYIPAGVCAVAEMSFDKEELESNDIAAVETIEFELEISDYDDWTADSYATEDIVLTPTK
ncbi:MAG: hypothetical protein IJ002_05105 [Clostridia bacterium]|nr:hypothetical protein [Clostridia bacterium]